MYQTISEKTQQKCRQHRTHHTLCHWNHLWQKQIESLLSTFLRSAFQFWGDLDNCWKRQKGHVDSQYVCGDLFNKRKLVANLRWKISFFKRILPIESTQKEKHDQRSNLRSVHFRTKTKAFYGKSGACKSAWDFGCLSFSIGTRCPDESQHRASGQNRNGFVSEQNWNRNVVRSVCKGKQADQSWYCRIYFLQWNGAASTADCPWCQCNRGRLETIHRTAEQMNNNFAEQSAKLLRLF